MNVSTPSEPYASPMVERLSTMQWNRFHTVIVLLFGMGWAMDAFEVTLIGNVLGALKKRFNLGADAIQPEYEIRGDNIHKAHSASQPEFNIRGNRIHKARSASQALYEIR